MITGAILNLFYNFISFIIGLFPTGELGIPTGFTDALTLAVSYLHTWSWLLPVDDMLVVAISAISFEVTVLLVKVSLWIIRTIRGSGS